MGSTEVSKTRLHKAASSGTVSPRRQSLTAHLTRSARRFSAAVAPQLTKLDPLPVLQNYQSLNIRLADVAQLQAAIERYVVKNIVQFSPIDFEVTDTNNIRILNVSLHPEEMVLTEGARRIFSVTFDDSDPEEYGTVIAKIRHPISGMRVFEFVELPCSDVVQISSYIDQSNRCRIEPASNSVLNFFSTCGCFFTQTRWQFMKEGKIYALIRPNGSLFDENSLRLEWMPQADNELRMLVIGYGMTQMVREAFPSLIHIIGEQHQRRTG